MGLEEGGATSVGPLAIVLLGAIRLRFQKSLFRVALSNTVKASASACVANLFAATGILSIDKAPRDESCTLTVSGAASM